MTAFAHDPRWEWLDVTTIDGKGPAWIRGRCRHTEVVDVSSCVTGEILARLCTTCDEQLPPPGAPVDPEAFIRQFYDPDLTAKVPR